jgi:hypothetical protein
MAATAAIRLAGSPGALGGAVWRLQRHGGWRMLRRRLGLTEATSGGIEQLLERIKTTPPAW